MRRRDDELDDVDLLEPIAPGSDDDVAGVPVGMIRRRRPTSGHVRAVKIADPHARRLRVLAAALAVTSLAQLGAAAYLTALHDDLRGLEEAWRTVLAVDADRAAADQALDDVATRFGDSPGLQQQRDLLYDAARARFERLEADVQELSTSGDRLHALKTAMMATLQTARRGFRDDRAPAGHREAMTEVTNRLSSLLGRWRLAPDSSVGAGARLTTARELIERLARMADEPTGLTIGALARDGLYVIDVDRGHISRHAMDVSDDAVVHALADRFVVVDAQVATAYLPASHELVPQWTIPAERAFTTADGLWVQAAARLTLVDASRKELENVAIPAGARLVGVTRSARPLVSVPTLGLHVVDAEGAVEPASTSRRFRGSGSFGTNGDFAAALDDRGRVLVGRLSEDARSIPFSALRAPLPPFVDLAVLS